LSDGTEAEKATSKTVKISTICKYNSPTRGLASLTTHTAKSKVNAERFSCSVSGDSFLDAILMDWGSLYVVI
jgi:hypothetical protein